MKDGGVGGVHRVGTVNAPRHNDADRQLALEHGAHLHGRGLGAQQNVVGHIKGVLRVAGGVVARNVEHLKIVEVIFHLRAVDNLVAHADKDLFDLVEHQVQGVLVAHRQRHAGRRDVKALLLSPQLKGGCGNGVLFLLEQGFQFAAQLVCKLTEFAALLGFELAHLLHDGGELAFFAQKVDARLLKRREVDRLFNDPQRALFELT